MPSTHLSLHYHLVFSTKNRAPVIDTNWRDRLHAYLGGSVRKIGGVAESIGGTNDHVHLLVGLRATHRLADVMEDIKSVSSLAGSSGNRNKRLLVAGRIWGIHRQLFSTRKSQDIH